MPDADNGPPVTTQAMTNILLLCIVLSGSLLAAGLQTQMLSGTLLAAGSGLKTQMLCMAAANVHVHVHQQNMQRNLVPILMKWA